MDGAERAPAVNTDRTTVAAADVAQKLVGRQALRSMMRRENRAGLCFLAGHLGLIALSTTLVHFAIGNWLIVPATLLHGFFIVTLFAPLHECSHGTAFRSRPLNEAVYWGAALALGLPPLYFRLQHADHHTYTQDVERDPQMIRLGERLWGYLFYASAIPYFRDIVRTLLRHASGRLTLAEQRYVYPQARRAVFWQARIMLAVYAAIAIVSVATGSWVPLTYWLIPRIVAEPLERLIRLSEHNGCARTPDMLENTRTVHTWAPLRLLSWNMPLHTAHHMAPLVPFHALPALDRAIAGHAREVRAGYLRAVGHELGRLAAAERQARARLRAAR
jgi:fatty acid desaturase